MKIDDPHAAEALREHMADAPDAGVRALYVTALRRLPGAAPAPALADQAVRDVDAEIRRLAVAALAPDRYPARAEAARPLLAEGLRSDRNAEVRRAAAALGTVGDARAVPDLIRSLVTSHDYAVTVPDDRRIGASAGAGGLGGAGGTLPPGVEIGLRTGQYPGGGERRSQPLLQPHPPREGAGGPAQPRGTGGAGGDPRPHPPAPRRRPRPAPGQLRRSRLDRLVATGRRRGVTAAVGAATVKERLCRWSRDCEGASLSIRPRERRFLTGAAPYSLRLRRPERRFLTGAAP